MAVVGAVVAVIGLGLSIDAANKQERATEEEARNIASQEASDRAIQRRKLVRQQRIKRAQLEQAAINTGVSDSSGEIAGVGGLASDFAIGQGFLASREATSLRSLESARDIGKARVQSATGSALQSVGFQVIGANLEGKPDLEVDQEVDDVFSD